MTGRAIGPGGYWGDPRRTSCARASSSGSRRRVTTAKAFEVSMVDYSDPWSESVRLGARKLYRLLAA